MGVVMRLSKLGLVLCILGIAALVWAGVGMRARVAQSENAHRHMLYRPAPDFALVDQYGRAATLSQWRGDAVVLYFGYTHCPDTCPTTMLHMTRVQDALGPDAERVHFLFVTVDPERDTPQRLREFLAAYDPEFVGLSGSRASLEEVWRVYGVYANREAAPEFPDGYRMRHSWVSYVIDTKGDVRLVRALDNPAEAVAAALRALLSGSSPRPSDPPKGRENPQVEPALGGSATRIVEMKDFRFEPQELRIPRGTTVRFVNREPVAHNVVQTTPETLDAGPFGFESPQLMRAEGWSYRFDEPGEYPILCTVGRHYAMGMTGRIIVE